MTPKLYFATMHISDLATLNAFLNGTSALLLYIGHGYIKKNKRQLHKRYMIAAFCVSSVFLASYLIYHYFVGSVPYQGVGIMRPIYFTILISHVTLAVLILPFIIITLRRGLAANYPLHKKMAKYTYPVWLYVSISGVVVYVMLYRL